MYFHKFYTFLDIYLSITFTYLIIVVSSVVSIYYSPLTMLLAFMVIK